MTREEAIKWLVYHKQGEIGKAVEALEMAIKALEQEPCDYKALYENYLKKSSIVIEQLRADRDRLLEDIDKIRAEIEDLDIFYDNDYFSSNKDAMFKRSDVLQIIDKYKAESEDKE